MKESKEQKLFIFPTDTVPGIGCFLSEECIDKLRKVTRRPGNKPFAILIPDEDEIGKWVSEVPEAFHSLSDLMPGPITLIFKGKKKLPAGVLSPEGTVGIRVPDHEQLLEILKKEKKPMVATSANITGKSPPASSGDVQIDADEIIEGEDGSGIASTVLDISGKKPTLLRKGEINISQIEEKLEREIFLHDSIEINILFVCAANLCRSPMAEAHLKSITEDLKWVNIRSAGVRAMHGVPTSMGAGKVLEEEGIDFHHLSVQVALSVIKWADFIFVMEKEHRVILLKRYSDVKNKIFMLRNFKNDKKGDMEIYDPIGRDLNSYREVFSIIKKSNKRIESYLRRKKDS